MSGADQMANSLNFSASCFSGFEGMNAALLVGLPGIAEPASSNETRHESTEQTEGGLT